LRRRALGSYLMCFFQVRSSPTTFTSVLIKNLACQKLLNCRIIRCSTSRFHSMSTLVILFFPHTDPDFQLNEPHQTLVSSSLDHKSRTYFDFFSVEKFASAEIAPGIKLLRLRGKDGIFDSHTSRNGNTHLAWTSTPRSTHSLRNGWVVGLGYLIKQGTLCITLGF